MVALTAVDPSNVFLTEMSAVALMVLAIWALANCFFGCALFRVVLAVYGALAGIGLGIELAELIRQAPTSGDRLVASAALAVLLGLGAWFAYRAAFTLGVAWVVLALAAPVFGRPPTAAGWAVGLLLAGVVGVMTWCYLRRAIMAGTAVVGAVLNVYAVSLLCLGRRSGQGLLEETFGPEGRQLVGWLLVIFVVLLASVGMVVQAHLAHAVNDVFMPKDRRRRTGRPAGDTNVRPKFTKV